MPRDSYYRLQKLFVDVLGNSGASAHESETPPILGRYVILYIGKIFASVCYSENPYLGLNCANIFCNSNW